MLILFNPLLFQVVVDPSLSPFIPTITIVCGGRHLSRMQPFSLIPNLHRARTFFIFVSMTAPSGKAMTSFVGNADTFPKREGIFVEREHSPPFYVILLYNKSRYIISSIIYNKSRRAANIFKFTARRRPLRRF